MIGKTEAQPEALRLATLLDVNYHEPYVEQAAATELRRQHAEIERLRALAATCYAGLGGECDLPVIWLDALNDAANGEPFDTDGLLPYTSAIRAQLTAQTNRAAAAEQQVTALTHRLDMANRLNTDARNELAHLSARQAAPDGWRLVPTEPTSQMLHVGRYGGDKDTPAYGKKPIEGETAWPYVADHTAAKIYRAMLSAAPPPPEREPLTLAQIDGIGDATGKPSFTWHYEFARAIERAHGIGATND